MREARLFNEGWMFHPGDIPNGQAADTEDSAWRTVTIPHDWSIAGPFDQKWASATGYLPGGIGWYKKTFTLPNNTQSERVYIHFDGVYKNSDVWINGHHLGYRPSGFTGFRYDITPFLQDENTLSVRVDHSEFGDARWYTGSGINRSVHLITTAPVHIGTWGVAVKTPAVMADKALARTEVTIQNSSMHGADLQIELTILDPQGTPVAAKTLHVHAGPETEHTVRAPLSVPRPQLWSLNSPAMYILRTSLVQDGVIIDTLETPFGIRTLHFDPNHGFFLNKQSLKLKGVCVHDDAGALGTAVPVSVWQRRLEALKACGVNALRMSHNPHMPELYDLCDRMGILVQDEAFDEWELGKNKWIAGWNAGQPGRDGYHSHFAEWAHADLRNMLLANRNHPSIIMWSIGNEIDYPNDPYSHEALDSGTNPQSYGSGFKPGNPHANRLGEVACELAAIVKEYDASRPVTAGLASALISNETGYADALDLCGYNYQEGRYAADHAHYPKRVLYGSENGMRWANWQAVLENDYICGQFLWTGIDYLGEAGMWPARSSGSGLLDLAGLPKPEYYFRQSLWTEKPMVWIGTRDVPAGEEPHSLWHHNTAHPVWNGTEGKTIRVCCFTNCDSAELFVNGVTVGIRQMAEADDHILTWDIPYARGTITANALADNEIVSAVVLKTSGPAARITAETDTISLTAGGLDVAHIAVHLTDTQGVPVYHSDNTITWTLTGPAALIGIESGDHNSHEPYQAFARKAYHGRLLGYVQSTKDSGDITVTLTGDGLEPATIILTSV